ncbi:MAG: pentapeptide repeat-containing protein [Nitrosomonas sp.]
MLIRIFKNRVLIIASVAFIEIKLFLYFYNEIVYFIDDQNLSNIPWLSAPVTMLIAAPVAYFIWIFRNADKKRDQEHVEENIRQTDFHQLEQWATGDSEKISLQTAAIWQLLPYLKGEYGERFIRPAMEIYRSVLSSWKLTPEEVDISFKSIRPSIDQGERIQTPNVISAIHEELNFFLKFLYNMEISTPKNWIPLRRMNLKCIPYENGTDFSGINLLEADLSYSICLAANFAGANLKITNFDCSVFYSANFRFAILESTNFRGAELPNSDFRNANFKLTKFKLTQLNRSDFRDTDLGRVLFYKINFKDVDFTGATFINIVIRTEDPFSDKYTVDERIFNAYFEEAILEGANFQNAIFEEAVFFEPVNLDQSKIDQALLY